MGQTNDVTDRSETTAEVFDRLFLPSLAAPWAIRVAEAAHLAPGDGVLDVACGTGAVIEAAFPRVGPNGNVVGVDLSPDMLAVARRKMPDLELKEGRAESLPFEDETFDAVTCQFGLMFFENREQALREMRRVLRTKGRIAIAVWESLSRTPGYAALTELIERHLGVEAGKPVRAAFALGDVELVRTLLDTAAFDSVEAASVEATACFPSLEAWVEAEVRGWIGGDFGEAEYAALLDDARQQLADYKRDDGAVEFAMPRHHRYRMEAQSADLTNVLLPGNAAGGQPAPAWPAIRKVLDDTIERARAQWSRQLAELPMADAHKAILKRHWRNLAPEWQRG